MPLNESTRKRRERWPVEFDLEGIPRNSATRQALLDQKRQQLETQEPSAMNAVKQPKNFFAADQPLAPQVIDINNPPVPRYGTPQNPRKQYPKMLYNHETGRVLVVQNAAQHKVAMEKHGFQEKPSPNHDYANARSGSIAPLKQEGPEREHVMTVEELEALEAQELAALEENQNQQSEEEAEAEVAAQLGEASRSKKRK